MLRAKSKELFIGQPLKDIYAGRSRATAADRYVEAVLADAPLGFWKMDETSGLPQDSSGNGKHMTTANVSGGKVYRVPGPMDGAYGIWQTVTSNFEQSTISTATDNFTMELLFKFATAAADDHIIYNGAGANGWGVWVQVADRKFKAGMFGVGFMAASTNALSNGTSYHLIHVVRRSGTWEYYLNGVVDTANAGTTAPVTPTAGITRLGSPTSVAGYWSMCAIYNTALSATRIAAHYAATGL